MKIVEGKKVKSKKEYKKEMKKCIEETREKIDDMIDNTEDAIIIASDANVFILGDTDKILFLIIMIFRRLVENGFDEIKLALTLNYIVNEVMKDE